MAAKKDTSIQSVLTFGALLVVGYFGYRLMFGKKVQAASTGGYYGGGSTGKYYPSDYGQQSNSSSNALMNFLRALLGKGSGKSGGGGSGMGNPGIAATKGSGGGINPLQTLNDFVNAGNADYFNSTDSETQYSGIASQLADYQIASTPYTPALFDVNQSAQSYNPYGEDPTYAANADAMFAQSDPFSQTFSIPYQDSGAQFDVSQVAQDYNYGAGGDTAQYDTQDWTANTF